MLELNRELTSSVGTNSSSYMSRFSELERMGIIKVTGQVTDPVTGNLCNIYDVTAKLPIPYKKKKTASQKLIEYRLLLIDINNHFSKNNQQLAQARLKKRIDEIEGK